MKKRILSTLLCLCMLLIAAVAMAPTAYALDWYNSGSLGDCNWELSDTVLTIWPKGSTRNATWWGIDFTYPEGYFPSKEWFYITEVIINEGVTCIGTGAFAGEGLLEKVTLPRSLTTISDDAFYGCTSLSTIKLPENLTHIGASAFSYTVLESITIPKSVVSIDDKAFQLMDSLQEIKVSQNNPNYSSEDGVLYNKSKTILLKYPEGKPDHSFTVPDSVTSLNAYCFYSVKHLYELTLPDTIVEMGHYALKDAYFLKNPAYNVDGVHYIGNYLVGLDKGVKEIVVRPGTRMIAADALTHSTTLRRLVLNEDIISLGYGSITYCYILYSIYIPKGLQLVQEDVFDTCTNLDNYYYGGSKEDAKKISYKEYGNYTFPTYLLTFNCCTDGPDHAWMDGDMIKAATCTEEGQGERLCEKCGRTEKGVLSKAPHAFVETFNQAPTCTTAGKIVDTCSACGLTEETYPAALGHSFSEWAAVTTVTCTEDGLNRRTCSTCGLAEEETVPALGHSFSEWTLEAEATCTEDGLNRRTCSACFLIEENYPAAFGHSFDEWTTSTEATCTDDGLNTRTCATCELVEEETVPAFGHSFSEWATDKEATCTEEGKSTRTCATCSTVDEEAISALGHSFGEFSVTTAPSLLKTGEQTALCSRCDETKTEELPKKVLFVDWDSETIPVVCVAGVVLFLAAGALGVIIGRKKKK